MGCVVLLCPSSLFSKTLTESLAMTVYFSCCFSWLLALCIFIC